ncbi:tyrosine-type recombinase/integrase [Nocardia asteroides]
MTNDTTKRARRAEPIDTHTAKNGKVTYWFQVDVGVRPDGRRDRQRFTYTSKSEARREYRRISTEVANGTYVGPAKITVGEHIGNWLDGRRDVRRVTLEGYRDALKPVVARLGGLPLQQLTKAHVDDLVTWRLTEGRQAQRTPGAASDAVLAFIAAQPDGVHYARITEQFGEKGARHLGTLLKNGKLIRPKRGLYVATTDAPAAPEPRGVSERTVTTMLIQLSAALDDAVAQGLVTRNVARLVKRPDVNDTEMNVWTRDQAAAFRAHVREHRLYALFLLSLCGMRRSEIMGLRWSRIVGTTLTVARGRVAIGKDTEEGDPKSRRSRRALPLPADVMAALNRFRVTQRAEALALGRQWSDDGLVAVDEAGEPFRPEWYSDEFQRQAKAAGLPVIRLHDTRHTAATILLDSGASVAVAAKWLGHDPAILLRVYGHVYDEALESAGAALFGGTESATGT